jgi:hypothetical protein
MQEGVNPISALPLAEPAIILTPSKLDELLKSASCKAQESIISLQDELRQAKERESAANARLEHLEENQAILFSLISKFKAESKPQPMQKDRGEILVALLAANQGKLLAKDARQKMHMSKTRFSLLVSSLKDEIESRPYHLDKRQAVLILK